MTEPEPAPSGVATQAALAATILEEEDRRLREAAGRERTSAPEDDAYLDGPLLPAGTAEGEPGPADLRATRARVRRLGTARGHAVALSAAAIAIGGLLASADRATGTSGAGILVTGAICGAAAAIRPLRSAVRRDTAPLLRRAAQSVAGAAVAAPSAAGLPDPLGTLVLVTVIGVLVNAVAMATAVLLGVTAGEGRSGRLVVLVAAGLRLGAYGLVSSAIFGRSLEDVTTLRALVLGGIPAGLTVAGALWAMAGATVGDLAAAAIGDTDAPAPGTPRRGGSGGDAVPAMEVRHVDFSYGHVQVLFDVSLEVRDGEVLALLGTNGAGKSTLLRAISGLSPIDRGTIHHRGTDITFADPGTRVRGGIVQLPGGKATFPSLTVVENLLAGGYTHIWDKPRLAARIEEVVEIFPILRDRLDQAAGTLSGGEQQMLAFAKALLLEPDVLCIDELSLGLAPLVVQELLAIVERLKAGGLTMVIVEQSLNVALALADRAVFMEKGRVRFDGPARELAERGDLARAVFLGGEGG